MTWDNMKRFVICAFIVISAFFNACESIAAPRKIPTVAVISDTSQRNGTTYLVCGAASDIIATDIINRLNQTGRIKAPLLGESMSKITQKNLSLYYVTFFREYKYNYNVDFVNLKRLTKNINADYILMITSGLDTQTEFFKETWWSKWGISSSEPIRPNFKLATLITLIDKKTYSIVWQDLYQREVVSAVITIPENYEAHLLAGKHTALRVTTNGAFPVKSRAVSAAVMSIAAEQTMQTAAANMLRAGAPSETLAKLKTAPVALVDQNLFNVLSGYAGYIVPVVTPVILQAVLLMGITMAVGGWLAENPAGGLMRAIYKRRRAFAALYASFWIFGMLWIGYAMGIDFVFFDFSSMQNPLATLVLMALFIAAVVSFGLAAVFAMNSNAYSAQMLVVISAPSVFLSGAVFPAFDFAWPAQVVRLFIPTTPGINGLVAAAQNAASLASVWPDALHLGILAAGYGLLAYWLYLRRAHDFLAQRESWSAP